MEYTRLGRSGLRVSRIALGCMSFGDPASGHLQWSLPQDDALPYFRQALDLGITFWDTANVTPTAIPNASSVKHYASSPTATRSSSPPRPTSPTPPAPAPVCTSPACHGRRSCSRSTRP